MVNIEENTKQLLNSISKDIVLVGVTKYSDNKEVEESINAGLKHIGENRIDLVDNIKDLNVTKHFIGNIQSNNIREIVENFDMIQSVSTVKHITKINNESKKINKIQEILIQLKISEDENKVGVTEKELPILLEKVDELKNIKFSGFMMMASNTEDKSKIRLEFRKAKELFDNYKNKFSLKYLSMGMTKDYNIALEEGSNMIRVGSKIFKNS